MSLRRSSLVAAAVGVLAAGIGCPSQSPAQSGRWVEPPSDLPRAQRSDRTRSIDFLFEALKVAPDDTSAKAVEDRIWAVWVVSGSDTADLLMSRVKQAIEKKEIDLAIRLLNTIIEIRPSYLEAWNRRATMYFLKKDYGNSLADLQHVLAHEPRHFGALAGLGTILEEVGQEKRALDAFRRALAVHPRLKGIPDHVQELTAKVEGRDI